MMQGCDDAGGMRIQGGMMWGGMMRSYKDVSNSKVVFL